MGRTKTLEADEIRQGETLQYSIGFKDNTDLTTNWTCRVVIGAIDKVVTLQNGTNTRFIVALDETETRALAIGVHQMGIEIENLTLTPDVRKEHIIEIADSLSYLGQKEDLLKILWQQIYQQDYQMQL